MQGGRQCLAHVLALQGLCLPAKGASDNAAGWQHSQYIVAKPDLPQKQPPHVQKVRMVRKTMVDPTCITEAKEALKAESPSLPLACRSDQTSQPDPCSGQPGCLTQKPMMSRDSPCLLLVRPSGQWWANAQV